MVIHRIFNMTGNAFSDSKKANSQVLIEQIRECLQTLLHDCKDMRTQRALYKINVAQPPVPI